MKATAVLSPTAEADLQGSAAIPLAGAGIRCWGDVAWLSLSILIHPGGG